MHENKNNGKPIPLPAPYLRSVLEKRDAACLAAALMEREYAESLRLSMLREFPDLPWQLRFLLTHPEMADKVGSAGHTSGTVSDSFSHSMSHSETAENQEPRNAGRSAEDQAAGGAERAARHRFFRLQVQAGTPYPFLRELLAQMDMVPDKEIRSFGTDGLRFYVFGETAVSFEDYTHMLMHAVFQHMVLPDRIRKRVRGGRPSALWDLAADMSAEYMRATLFPDSASAETFLAVKAPLPSECDPSDPLSVYLALGDLFEDDLEPLYDRFRRDDHRYWYHAPAGLFSENTPDANARRIPEQKLSRILSEKKDAENTSDPGQPLRPGDPRVSPDALKDMPKGADDPSVWQEWLKKKVTERWFSSEEEMTSGLGRSRSGQYGMAPGSREEKMILREIGKYDFTRYLQRFSTLREEMSLDQASFDYIPYYYGLMRYGNMPLLEPLEYTESRKVEELVIAIDTSGSCSLPIVQRFFAEIERILMNRENFFRKMNIHIIQCDSIIQDHTVIHSQEEWKLYRQNLTIKGRGGTNFEPVFRLVGKLRDGGDLQKLKGLLYFTDGDGAYPRYPTDYETAFVFTTRKALQFKIPEWIVPLCLDMQPAEKAPMFRT